jgi:hypothetical protein
MPVILATQEAEIRRITVQSQPRQIVWVTLSQKYPTQKKDGGVAQGVGPEFKSQYHQKKSIWALVAHACNPSYLGGWDWEDHGLEACQGK